MPGNHRARPRGVEDQDDRGGGGDEHAHGRFLLGKVTWTSPPGKRSSSVPFEQDVSSPQERRSGLWHLTFKLHRWALIQVAEVQQPRKLRACRAVQMLLCCCALGWHVETLVSWGQTWPLCSDTHTPLRGVSACTALAHAADIDVLQSGLRSGPASSGLFGSSTPSVLRANLARFRGVAGLESSVLSESGAAREIGVPITDESWGNTFRSHSIFPACIKQHHGKSAWRRVTSDLFWHCLVSSAVKKPLSCTTQSASVEDVRLGNATQNLPHSSRAPLCVPRNLLPSPLGLLSSPLLGLSRFPPSRDLRAPQLRPSLTRYLDLLHLSLSSSFAVLVPPVRTFGPPGLGLEDIGRCAAPATVMMTITSFVNGKCLCLASSALNRGVRVPLNWQRSASAAEA